MRNRGVFVRRPIRRASDRRARPAVEGLEPRVALALSALDPAFGAGGAVLGALDAGDAAALSAATAVAVQPDGKVVVAGTFTRAATAATAGGQQLAVRRYNADGTVDAAFGGGGQATIALPQAIDAVVSAPHSVEIGPDGSIVLAALVEESPPAGAQTLVAPATRSLVVRLTADGRPDPAFGTAGAVELSAALGTYDRVAVQADGRVVLAGISVVIRPDDPNHPLRSSREEFFTVVRLTTGGALDPSFHATGSVGIEVDDSDYYSSVGTVVAVGLNPAGQILVTATSYVPLQWRPVSSTLLLRVNGDGTPDTALGGGGKVTVVAGAYATDMAVQADGSAILVGNQQENYGLGGVGAFVMRVAADGQRDIPFAQAAATATPSPYVAYNSVAIQPDGRIVVGGSTHDPYQPSTRTSTTFGIVDRYLSTGARDPGFGTAGRVVVQVAPSPVPGLTSSYTTQAINDVALAPDGRVVTAGTVLTLTDAPLTNIDGVAGMQAVVARLLPIAITRPVPNDYDHDGRSDVAAHLTAFATFASRPSGGGADVLIPFGVAGPGQAIPAPGDYDGDGRSDIAAYLPAYGVLAYRPSSGGADVVVPFGIAGAGQTIPAPGDYDGDGRTDVAAYFPALGLFAVRPSSGSADVLTPFGAAGADRTIPAPGDYDGDGKTDIAAFFSGPALFAYRPTAGGQDVVRQFGVAGIGQTVPAPGDYDGDGKADIAAYFPALGVFAYRESFFGFDFVQSFGVPGPGASIPAPGDYDSDGRTDVAVYLPALGLFASRPTAGGADVVVPFGAPGAGQTIPAASIPYAAIPYAQPDATATATGGTGAVSAAATTVVSIPLADDDLLTPISRRKRRALLG